MGRRSKIPTIEETIAFAAKAHEGQLDKMHQPYILHPMRVMLMMLTFAERTVAILHDVVEDTDATLQDLLDMGYPKVIIDAIDSVTKRKGENYEDFIHRASENFIGRKIKKADILDNLSPIRRYNFPAEKRNRLYSKYTKALKILQDKELELGVECFV